MRYFEEAFGTFANRFELCNSLSASVVNVPQERSQLIYKYLYFDENRSDEKLKNF